MLFLLIGLRPNAKLGSPCLYELKCDGFVPVNRSFFNHLYPRLIWPFFDVIICLFHGLKISTHFGCLVCLVGIFFYHFIKRILLHFVLFCQRFVLVREVKLVLSRSCVLSHHRSCRIAYLVHFSLAFCNLSIKFVCAIKRSDNRQSIFNDMFLVAHHEVVCFDIVCVLQNLVFEPLFKSVSDDKYFLFLFLHFLYFLFYLFPKFFQCAIAMHSSWAGIRHKSSFVSASACRPHCILCSCLTIIW